MPDTPLVSIITVNFNQTAVTCALLDSVRRQHWSAVEVIVVDNGSDQDPSAYLAARYPEVRVLRSDTNRGFAGGNNLGIRAARGAYLFFLNNDTELTPDCIGYLVGFCQKTPDVGAVSPLICFFSEKNQTHDRIQYAGMTYVHPVTARNQTVGAGQADRGQFSLARPMAYAHGAAMLVPRSTLERVGHWPEEFFLYYEELDWCEQIRRAGLGIWIVPTTRIYHKESLTVARMGALKTYFLQRNRILFMQRNRLATLPKFYLYLFGVIVPKSLLSHALRGEWSQLRACVAAYAWHFFGLKNAYETLVQRAKMT
jgi:GT2 family glycosyltransferase